MTATFRAPCLVAAFAVSLASAPIALGATPAEGTHATPDRLHFGQAVQFAQSKSNETSPRAFTYQRGQTTKSKVSKDKNRQAQSNKVPKKPPEGPPQTKQGQP